jgi:hypothetical protein
MTTDVSLPLHGDKLTQIVFPQVCVYCNQPATTHKRVAFNKMHDKGGKRIPYRMEFQVPYCAEHVQENDAIKRIIYAPGKGYAALVILGVVLWIGYCNFVTGEGSLLKDILGGILGIAVLAIVPALGITIIWHLLYRLFNHPARDFPLLMFGEGSLGFKVVIQGREPSLEMRFTNDAVASRFLAENPDVRRW